MIDSQSLSALRAMLQVVKGLEHDLPKMVAQLPTETQVEIGHVLSALSKSSKKGLGAVKKSLRENARQRLTAQYGTETLRSKSVRAIVHFPRPSVVLRKEADIEALRLTLGKMFPVFFETVYVPTRDFREHLEDLEDAGTLLDAVDMPEKTPRVKFEEGPE